MDIVRLHIYRVDFYCVVEMNSERFTLSDKTIHGFQLWEGRDYYFDSKELKVKLQQYPDTVLYFRNSEGLFIRAWESATNHNVTKEEIENYIKICSSREAFEEAVIMPHKKQKEENEARHKKYLEDKRLEEEKRINDLKAEYSAFLKKLHSGEYIFLDKSQAEKWLEVKLFSIPLPLRRGFSILRSIHFRNGEVVNAYAENNGKGKRSKMKFETVLKIADCIRRKS